MTATTTTPTIDLSDSFSFADFRRNCAGEAYINQSLDELPDTVNIKKMLYDLHRLLVVIDGQNQLFITKEYDSAIQRFNFKIGTAESGKSLLSSINLKGYRLNTQGKWVHPNVWEIYRSGSIKNSFLKDGMEFYSTNNNIFSTWSGWKWKKLPQLNETIIKQWEEFVFKVICNENLVLAQRVHRWIAYPLQNVGKMNGICLFINGLQGSGKTVFTDVVSNIYKGFSLPCVNNPDIILGRFNVSRENQALIVLNEASSGESGYRNKIDMDAIKSPITDKTFQCEQKGLTPRTVTNINNFIITTNHMDSIILTSDDRRFQVIRVSDKYIKDTAIMSPFWDDNWTDELFDNLFTYYMNVDLTKGARTEIISTENREDIIEASKTSYEMFVEEYATELKNGKSCTEAFNDYISYCNTNRFKECSVKKFGMEMKKYCVRDRLTTGKRLMYYKLNDEYCKKLTEEDKPQDEKLEQLID